MSWKLPHPLDEFVETDDIEPWLDQWRIRKERELWVEVMRFQAGYGVFVHVTDWDEIFKAYERAAGLLVDTRDLRRIREIEYTTKHDVKARIERFNELAVLFYRNGRQEFEAAPEVAHVGMTSADVVDNLSLIQMREATVRLRSLMDTVGAPFHNVSRLTQLLALLPFRGIKGPVGTQQDMLDLFHGNHLALEEMDRHLSTHFGFTAEPMVNVGQVYPRSIDLMVATHVMGALPNMDRITPWRMIARGYLGMVANYSDGQWNEGDVSTSAVRRVALPGIFLVAAAAWRNRD
jgi:adenylosuccinate lyase